MRRILTRRQAVTGFDAYFRNVQRHGGEGVPTYSEAQKDFGNMIDRYVGYRS